MVVTVVTTIHFMYSQLIFISKQKYLASLLAPCMSKVDSALLMQPSNYFVQIVFVFSILVSIFGNISNIPNTPHEAPL